MSLVDIHDLQEAWSERQMREDYRFGKVASIIAEIHRDRDTRKWPYEPGDFFASLREDRDDDPELVWKRCEAALFR